MSLYLVPATRKNLETSIEKEVDPNHLATHLSGEVLAEIQSRAGMEGIRCWAMTVTLRSAFKAMQPGDIVLLSEEGTRRFTHYSQVTCKVENKALGDALWPVRQEKSWELIYFLRNIRRLSIPKADLVTKLGYKPNYEVPGSILVTEERIQDFESKHDPIADWLGVPYLQAEYTDVLGEVRDGEQADYSASNVLTATKRRRHHEIFAAKVKANYGMACAMCGISHPDFLVAGHIVAWSEDEQNRLNPANGLCLCVMHDRAFERGYLTLDEDLRIRMNPRLSLASPLGQQLKAIDGQRIRRPVAHPPAPELLRRHRNRFPPQE
ncbi:HNH endonuclease [Archangium gephyra]|uniref:HNH endonuclease n=1 Tax=Archangium gephyra TaxID=48 RepID=UPI003B7E70DC